MLIALKGYVSEVVICQLLDLIITYCIHVLKCHAGLPKYVQLACFK